MLEVAVDAAGAFIDVLTFPQDQVAVIGFDSDVVAHELTSDATTLHTQLQGLQSGTGTKIHLGVEAAHSELMSPRRRPENFPAMVVLTDGQANDGPEPAWFYEAASAEDLEAVYAAIAVDLPCPSHRYWGRR